MIPRSTDWKHVLAGAVRDPAELLSLLSLPGGLLTGAQLAASDFALRVPRPFVARMRQGDPNDPLLRQVLGSAEELAVVAGFNDDPVGELTARRSPGLLQKYRGRALLVVTGACAVHCRYCFRRHYPYHAENGAHGDFSEALSYLAADTSLKEVILSGGDPLMLDDGRLAALAKRLAAIPHLQRLRVHTRLPVVLPSRITDGLADWLTGTRLRPVMVIHVNHPAEIDTDVEEAFSRLRKKNIPLLNQSVLLAGINDHSDILCDLSERLFSTGVLPYYLHMLDEVKGAAHFAVDRQRALALVEEVRARLPGYLVPRLVREIPGAPAKTPLVSQR